MVTSNNIINTIKMPGTSWTTPTCLPVKLLFVQSVWIASKSLGTQQDFDVPVDCLHKKNVILPATVCKSRCNVQEACVGLTVPEMLGGWRWIHQMEVVSGLFQEQGRTRRYMDWQVKEFHFKVVLVVCVCGFVMMTWAEFFFLTTGYTWEGCLLGCQDLSWER